MTYLQITSWIGPLYLSRTRIARVRMIPRIKMRLGDPLISHTRHRIDLTSSSDFISLEPHFSMNEIKAHCLRSHRR